MGTRYIFAKDVEKLQAEGKKEMVLPQGTRLTPAAADLIKEMGIEVSFIPSSEGDLGRGQEGEGGSEPLEEAKPDTAPAFIAVASDGKNVHDTVAAAAARCRYFLLFDRQGNFLEVLRNPHREQGEGAGPSVAEYLAERGIKTMIGENFGRNTRASLDEKGIEYLKFTGEAAESVRSALKARGEEKRLSSANGFQSQEG